MVDLGGYVIVLVEKEEKIKLFGSASERNDCDEIIEINGYSLENASHEEIIKHIHECIKSRTICLRVKRKASGKLGNLAIDSLLIDAFIIGSQAREHLQKLTKDANITPKDIAQLSKILSDENEEIKTKSSSNSNTNSKESKLKKKNDNEDTDYFELNDNNMQLLNLNPNQNKLQKTDSQKSIVDLVKKFTNASLNENNLNKNSNLLQEDELNCLDENHLIQHNLSEATKYIPFLDLCNIFFRLESQIDDEKILQLIQKTNFKSLLEIYSNLMLEKHYHDFKFECNTIQLVEDVIELIKNKTNESNEIELFKILNDLKFKQIFTVLDYILNKKNFYLSKKNEKPEDIKSSKSCSANKIFNENTEKLNSDITTNPPPVPSLPNAQLLYSPSVEEIFQLNKHTSSPYLNNQENVVLKLDSDTQNIALNQSNSPKPNLELNQINVQDNEATVLSSPISQENSFKENLSSASNISCNQFPKISSNNYLNNQNIPLYSNQNYNSADFSYNALNLQLKTNSQPQTLVPNLIPPMFLPNQAFNQNLKLNLTNVPINNLDYTNNILPPAPILAYSNLNTLLPSYLTNLPTNISENTKLSIVRIEKHSSEPLGATVRNELDGRVTIGRIVCGGAAEKCTALQEGDEILMVNNISMRGKNVDQVCDLLSQMQGTLTFVIAKQEKNLNANQNTNDESVNNVSNNENTTNSNYTCKVSHFKAYFDYNPSEDIYIPCCELGVKFRKGDLLHVLDSSDNNWWQAYREGNSNQNLAGLIPSFKFQVQREEALKKINSQNAKKKRTEENYDECEDNVSSSKKSLLFNCSKKSTSKKKKMFKEDILLNEYYVPYEEVKQSCGYKRTIVLVGPNNIGRQYLRERLLKQKNLFAAAIPHTSRSKRNDEEDKIDYHFVSKQQFEQLIDENKFVEYGDYDKTYYGTAFSSIADVINSKKTCILNLHIQSIHKLRTPKAGKKFKPFFIFIAPPVQLDELQKLVEIVNHVQPSTNELHSILEEAWEIKKNYSHYFDLILTITDLDETFKFLLNEINSLEKQSQWIPASWL